MTLISLSRRFQVIYTRVLYGPSFDPYVKLRLIIGIFYLIMYGALVVIGPNVKISVNL